NKNTEMIHRDMGQAASAYLAKKLSHIQTMGISWGKSIYALAEEFQSDEQPHVHIVPLIGGMGQSHVAYHSNHLAFQLAQQLNASSSYVYAPAIADSVEMKQQLVQSKDVAAVLDEGSSVDFAIVGVGSLTQQTTAIEMGYLNTKDIESLKAAGAEGDLNSWFFDADGQIVEHPINDRIVGLSPDEIRETPEVMAIAEGEHKTDSLHTALTSGLANILVTDEQTAENLLKKCSTLEHF
ncbi:sugar-binding transcriptional regulator, partial [Lentibacillus sp.]|uniref:sugar-binding transcriptional regulator n=1 Tax=Lentibacillus sp. TaxID=1925746 RepID=UPI002B4B6183